ncbi:MAG: hypothetical protein AAFQ66_15710 [Pseudomonadota bacterium]
MKKLLTALFAVLAMPKLAGAQQEPIEVIRDNPSFILCTTKRNASDGFPVVRVLYLTKMQLTDGSFSSNSYETAPKPAPETGHTEHFLVQFDLSANAILAQIPLDVNLWPDCTRGTSMRTLKSNGQTGNFNLE